MNAHVKPIDTEQRDFVLAALRCSYLRVKLIENEMASIGVALKGGLISPEVAVEWAEENGIGELERRAELRRQEEVAAILARMQDVPPNSAPRSAKEPYQPASSTIDAFWYLVRLNDPARLSAWLDARPMDAPFLLKLLEARKNDRG
jgi:hypothetical protein